MRRVSMLYAALLAAPLISGATPLLSSIDEGFVQVIGRFATTDEGVGG